MAEINDSFENVSDESLEEDDPEEEVGYMPPMTFPPKSPYYLEGGDIGLQNFIQLAIAPTLAKGYQLGYYIIPVEFIVETNGRVSNAHLAEDAEITEMQIVAVVMEALSKTKWNPGMNHNGELVRTKTLQVFEITIQ